MLASFFNHLPTEAATVLPFQSALLTRHPYIDTSIPDEDGCPEGVARYKIFNLFNPTSHAHSYTMWENAPEDSCAVQEEKEED